jgi:hypothetical protein
MLLSDPLVDHAVHVTEEQNPATLAVIEWLNSSGATVELFTARALSANGLEVTQGLYLRDPETPETAREIDVIGTRQVQLVDVGTIAAYLVMECKYTPKPWVIVRGRPEYASSMPNFDRITTVFGRQWLDSARAHPAINQGHTFQQEARPGHALVTAYVPDDPSPSGTPRANKNNQDSAYAAIMGATKASRAWADFLTEQDKERGGTTFGVVFPVVVVRGPLYEAWLDGDKITARPIPSGQVYWNHPSITHPVIVDVVTTGELEGFTRRFRETAEALMHYGQDAAVGINATGCQRRLNFDPFVLIEF